MITWQLNSHIWNNVHNKGSVLGRALVIIAPWGMEYILPSQAAACDSGEDGKFSAVMQIVQTFYEHNDSFCGRLSGQESHSGILVAVKWTKKVSAFSAHIFCSCVRNHKIFSPIPVLPSGVLGSFSGQLCSDDKTLLLLLAAGRF